MRERSIILRDHEVQRILDGSKTMLRRTVKIPPRSAFPALWEPTEIGGPDGGRTAAGETLPLQGAMWNTRTGECLACQIGMVGDRLWLREAFMPSPLELPPKPPSETTWNIVYAADGEQRELVAPAGYNPMLYNYERWTSSIHMPRWASRLTLRVTDVRVERVQDITKADAIAEGARRFEGLAPSFTGSTTPGWSMFDPKSHGELLGSPQMAFANAWNHFYAWGPQPWEANPWVWVVSFEVEP